MLQQLGSCPLSAFEARTFSGNKLSAIYVRTPVKVRGDTVMKKGVKALLAEATSQIKTYEVEEAKNQHGRKEVVFIDVRDEPELHSEGKIPGSVHAPRGMLEFYIDPESPLHKDVFDEEKEFIFYCKSGGRSALAAQRAKEMGLERVASMNGGFKTWKERGGQVKTV